MIRLILVLLITLSLGVTGGALAETKDGYNSKDWLRCTTGEFDGSVDVTQTNTLVTFSKDSKALFVKNTGSNEVYVDPRDGVAVASDDDGGILIEAGKSRDLSAFQTHKVGLIASSGETTTVQLDACY